MCGVGRVKACAVCLSYWGHVGVNGRCMRFVRTLGNTKGEGLVISYT